MKKFFAALAFSILIASPAFAAIEVISGGVGEGEEARLTALQNDYSLKLVFSGDEGEYLADVPYTINDISGAVIASGVSTGPILLAKVPTGAYTVSATAKGIQRTQKVMVDGDLNTVQFSFKQ